MSAYTIDKQHFCGDGIAICEGRPIRIANALKGETVLARDVSVRRRRQAFLAQVIEPAPNRCDPVCDRWQRCPACQYACMTIDSQREIKQTQWLALIRKFVQIPENCTIEFYPAPRTLGYRCRIDAQVFHGSSHAFLGVSPRLDAAAAHLCDRGISAQELALLDPGDVLASESIAPISLAHCPMHAPELNALLDRVTPYIGDFPALTRFSLEAYRDSARIIVYSMPEQSVQTRSIAEDLAKQLAIAVIFQQLPPRGSHVYPKPEVLRGSPYHCYAHNELEQPLYALTGAWTPVNPDNAQLIRQSFMRMVKGCSFEHVLELGCGCGTHTTVFSCDSQQYTGIDAAWPAILSAQHNADTHKWDKVSFFMDTAEHYLEKRYYKGVRADTIVMHSNRMPYSEETARLCKRFGARDIYIAAPTAFAMAQECKHFCALGYHLCRLSICDTLPMTYHMMATAHLSL